MIDILLLTFNRKKLLQKTLEGIWERTRTPYRLIVVDNGSNDGTVKFLRRLKRNNRIDVLVENKGNPGLCEGYKAGYKYIESKHFIITQDDLIPPDLEPDWITQMVELLERHPEYGAVAMRVGRMINIKFNPAKEINDAKRACCAYFRVQRKKDIDIIGLGDRRWNEDIEFKKLMGRIGLKAGFATNIWANHIGHSQVPNKGYGDFTNYEGYDPRKNLEKQRKPYPKVDPKTNKPIYA